MKNLVIGTFLVFTTFMVNAQDGPGSAFGIKAGLNYNGNGDYFESINANAQSPDRNIGFHLGIYGKLGYRLYFRPEFVYTATKSSYDSDEFTMKKIDIPLLLGFNAIGPVHVFAGPTIQHILNAEFDGYDLDEIDNEFSFGLNFGIGVSFNKLGVELRYERGLNENEADFIDDNLNNGIFSRIDTRPDQLILSLSVEL